MPIRKPPRPPGIHSLASTILGEPVIVLEPDVLFALLGILDETHTPKIGRERRIIELHFGLNGNFQQTLEEIGRDFHVTRERIRQIEERALRKLRHSGRVNLLKAVCEPSPPIPIQTLTCPTCGGEKSRGTWQCWRCYSRSLHEASYVTVVCPSCGKGRSMRKRDLRYLKSFYHRACYFASRRETRPCVVCGEPISRPRSQFRGRVAVHGGACQAAWRRLCNRAMPYLRLGRFSTPKPLTS